MGVIMKYSCPECGYEKQLEEGSGLASIRLSSIRMIFSDEERAGFEKLFAENKIEKFFMEQEISCCEACSDLESVMVLHYQYKSGKKQLVRKPCPVCHNPVTKEREPVLCPKCGGKLEKQPVGHWD